MSKEETQKDWAPQAWFVAQSADDGPASYFGHCDNGYQRFRHDRLSRMLDGVAGTMGRTAMLDAGCATGALTERIRQRFGFARTVGVDFVPDVLARGRKRYPAIEFSEVALPNLPYGAGEFDLVLASEVLYYLTPNAQSQALDAFARVLRPGGYLLVGSVLGGGYFTPDGIRELLASEFDVISEDWLRMKPYHALVSPFYYASRLESLLVGNMQPGSQIMQARLRRYRPVLRMPPFRQAVRFLAWLGKPVLRNRRLPAVANSLARLTSPSNIAFLARRR